MVITHTCSGCATAVSGVCPRCWGQLQPARSGVAVPAAFSYEGVGRRLVVGLKYANARTVIRPMADRVGALVDPSSIDVVTWAPTSASRIHDRGFDQAEALAREVARNLGVPCRAMLRRARRDHAQTGRSRSERSFGPSFVARRMWRPQRVLVVDDVVTTGATLRAAASALRRAGAGEVRMVAAAATP